MMSMVEWKDMCEVLQDKEVGCAKVSRFTAGGLYSMMQGIRAGEYMKLEVNGELVMSNTNMEKRTSADFVFTAEGNVLICGLGLGMVIMPLLENPCVKSITVIEKYQDVIDCVLPQIKPYDKDNKLTVICEDCFNFKTDNRYDSIFIDIWPVINEDIYKEEMKPLKRKYRSFLSQRGKETKNIHVWAEQHAKNGWRLY